jgi:hypothetical protein
MLGQIDRPGDSRSAHDLLDERGEHHHDEKGRDERDGPANEPRKGTHVQSESRSMAPSCQGRRPSRLVPECCAMTTLAARLVAMSLIPSFLTACASGPIRGGLTRPDQPTVAAVLNYQSSILGGSGKLWTTLPTGEHFTGKYQLVPHARDRQMTSTLTGDRGSTMLCRFTLTEPGVGPDKGGTVQCQLSTGGTFDATF